MANHRAVERAPVSVVVAIHLAQVEVVSELDEPTPFAAAAFDQRERSARDARVARAWENAGEHLVAELQQHGELGVAADAALGDR